MDLTPSSWQPRNRREDRFQCPGNAATVGLNAGAGEPAVWIIDTPNQVRRAAVARHSNSSPRAKAMQHLWRPLRRGLFQNFV